MHLFAGAGGGLLADLILGHDPIIAVEWDRYCCQVLRERAAEGWFPNLHVWEGDVRLFDPSEYAGRVDCIHAGFPCQDISTAGKQAGLGEGTRSGLYREVLRIAGMVRPKRIFMENVSAILANGLGTVLADLAAMGYDARWCCLRASDVGAPHGRDRWFCVANTISGRWGPFGGMQSHKSKSQILEFEGLVSCNDERSISPWGNCKPQQKSRILGVVNGLSYKMDWDRIKACGNAQVPLQAAVAWKLLGGE